LIGTVPGDTAELVIPADFAFAPHTHFLIYTASNFSEQSYPSALAIVDTSASASNLAFLDLDLDGGELGGLLQWTPAQAPAVQDYLVYLDTWASFGGRSQLGTATSGSSLLVPAETAQLSYDLLAVYTRSSLAEQTTPVAIAPVDSEALAENVSFVDLDLDEFDLGGLISWLPAGDTALVASYVVYFAESDCDLLHEDANGTYTSDAGTLLENATAPALCNLLRIATVTNSNATNTSDFSIFLEPETLQQNYTHLAIFAKSVLVEQTTPASLLIFDAAASVSDLAFDDLDLDEQQLGGSITFLPPASSANLVDSYAIYLAQGAETKC
ncbi:unnamed protein product, partial [Symbiodinium sp. CCMP2592]